MGSLSVLHLGYKGALLFWPVYPVSHISFAALKADKKWRQRWKFLPVPGLWLRPTGWVCSGYPTKRANTKIIMKSSAAAFKNLQSLSNILSCFCYAYVSLILFFFKLQFNKENLEFLWEYKSLKGKRGHFQYSTANTPTVIYQLPAAY